MALCITCWNTLIVCNSQARPKKKTDWRAWSEAQLDLPPQDIPIPHPSPSRRTQLIPELIETPEQLSEDVQSPGPDELQPDEQQRQLPQQQPDLQTAEQRT
jgi:hypothetical protein